LKNSRKTNLSISVIS